MDVAAAFALASAAPVAPAAIFVVLQPIAGDARAILRQHAPHGLNTLLQRQFSAIELGGPLKNTVRQIIQILFYAGDAEIQIHLVVVRRDVAVADRPVFAVSVAVLGLEVVV